MSLEMRIEALLFYKTEPMFFVDIAGLLDVEEDEVRAALTVLGASLSSRGLRLLMTDTHVTLVTAPEASELIEHMRSEELRSDIGKAGAETLAIILYRGPIARADIDKIRGVNSNFILRNLLIRGLIERRAHPTDSRSFLYAGTPELLALLGITNRTELPEFADIMNALDMFEQEEKE